MSEKKDGRSAGVSSETARQDWWLSWKCGTRANSEIQLEISAIRGSVIAVSHVQLALVYKAHQAIVVYMMTRDVSFAWNLSKAPAG